MAEDQSNAEMNRAQLLAEQLELLKSLEAAQKSALQQQAETAETQSEMITNLYRFMRVTVDIQEVMLKRLNLISYAIAVLVAVSLVAVLVLLTL
jgi:hypothetical protein